jgi:hypothetical protein
MSGQGEEKAGGGGLRHVALFYRDRAEYRARILGFVRAGLTRGDPSFIAVPGDEAPLPEQQAFIDRHPGQHVHFVGEPIWADRSPAEICEATRHEALINLAFPRTRITILCRYDLARLAPSAIADAPAAIRLGLASRVGRLMTKGA